ncbi:MAG: hypothetical protein BKP49_06655 [Treponema sp. CETP13]|nr:MAG: hypothetical protein BKP49_06655 [Treponema sp. CETP13]
MNGVTSSETAQIIVTIIPIVGIAIGGIVIFFYLLWRNSQIKLLIKTGHYLPKRFNLSVFSLLAGILLTAVGIVLTVLFIAIDGITYSLLGGLIPLAVGIGFIIFNRIYNPSNDNKN